MMNIFESIQQMHKEVSAWRRDLHAHPETAFDEVRTSEFVAQRLQELGLEVHRGLGKTGVVGSLTKGAGDKAIGLRADMDALFIQEENRFAHCSKNDGKMHACGHDGHTAMLLGAAKYLAESGRFDGTVRFIFQPAEETGDEECGGNAMVKDGLFEQFPVECIFGMHNFPGIPVGHFAVRSGPMAASIDTFEFKLFSEHNHPATQHQSPDPILAASRVVEAFHSYKARRLSPAEPVILSITQFQAGDPINDRQGVHITPPEAYVRGTIYTLNDAVRDILERDLDRIVQGIGAADGCECSFRYERGYPVLVNSEREKQLAVAAACLVAGEENVQTDMQPMLGAEDFAFMLQQRPGCYLLIGNGTALGEAGDPCHLHNPHYDFNDAAIPAGMQYWVNLVETYLRP